MSAAQHQKDLNPAQKVARLNVQPGMKIVDIGSGAGIYAFPLARALQGKGTVYATDIYPEMLAYIDQKKQELNLPVIKTVLVQKDGLDNFYKENHFDIIFMARVLPQLNDPLKYLTDLRRSLKTNTGRLYILNTNAMDHYYYDKKLTDYAMLKILNTSADLPVQKKLTADLRLNKKQRRLLINDLAKILKLREYNFVYTPLPRPIEKDPWGAPMTFNKFNTLTACLYYNLKQEAAEQNSGFWKLTELEQDIIVLKQLLKLAGYKFVKIVSPPDPISYDFVAEFKSGY